MLALALPVFLRFESPQYLVLLALLPLVIVVALRSMAGLGRARRLRRLPIRR